MKLFQKLFLLFLFICVIAQHCLAQSPKQYEVSIIPGYATFSAHQEQGMSLAGEFTYKFNRWVNPSLRISSASGFRLVDEGMGAYRADLNSLSLNANIDILNPRSKHVIQLGGGPAINLEMYSDLFAVHVIEGIGRNVNEIIAVGRLTYSLDYFVRYKYRLSDHFLLGLEWSETGLLTTGWIKQSALSFMFNALVF